MTESNNDFDVVVIGGGGAGIVAAISAARKGARTLICEKTPRLGKKVRISGNGRCNITNDRLDAGCYDEGSKEIVESIFSRFGRQDILHFFKELGLRFSSDKEGRVFPVTNQSASVLDALELELSKLGVEIRYSAEVTGVRKTPDHFLINLKSEKISARHPILCAGGKSFPIYGTDGSAYELAKSFGHRMIDPVPSTVPLLVDDAWCRHLTGQKITAMARYLIGGVTGPPTGGDLLFTDYGLSGTAILDCSEEISIAIYRSQSKDVAVLIDLLPFIHEEELKKELSRRLRRQFPDEKLLLGLLPPKFSYVLQDILKTRNPAAIASFVKKKSFTVSGTRGWNEAEFTAGGVDHHEVDARTLESKKCRGFYLAGEILDVNGKRGGFNLAWAWASGFVAGLEAVGS